ncbi:MAG: hypothetical protein JST93_35035 [Acidobacteria bacterium]|nr:hypothetical protein [Acidobacteriota bacterium]
MRKPMKVFISYGHADDQVTALRLQALGVANGLTIYVPPAHTRSLGQDLGSDTGHKLNESEIVLGLIGETMTEACRQELNKGIALRKNMIVMCYPHLAQQLKRYYSSNLVVIDQANPDRSEVAIVAHLREIDARKQAKEALLALSTLALGLMLMAPARDKAVERSEDRIYMDAEFPYLTEDEADLMVAGERINDPPDTDIPLEDLMRKYGLTVVNGKVINQRRARGKKSQIRK